MAANRSVIESRSFAFPSIGWEQIGNENAVSAIGAPSSRGSGFAQRYRRFPKMPLTMIIVPSKAHGVQAVIARGFGLPENPPLWRERRDHCHIGRQSSRDVSVSSEP
jgi:hypothetical protein